MGTLHPKPPKNLPATGERLDSWKEIARYLNRYIRTVQRWEETAGLPVYRRSEGRLKGSPVYAFKGELDAWMRQNPPLLTEGEPCRPAPTTFRKANWIFWATAGVLCLLAVSAASWWFLLRHPTKSALRVVQMTSYAGQETQPAFSPDGKQVAFSWNGETQDNFDVYVRFVDGGQPLRLTTHPGMDGWPAWSPDGRLIAFARWVFGSSTAEVLTVPALGGPERKIAEFRLPPQPSAYFPAFCWTPDGKWIIAEYSPAGSTDVALALLSINTLEARPLTRPVASSAGDCCPAISPDGRRIAFRRSFKGRIWNLFVLPLDTGFQPLEEPRQLTNEAGGAWNPMWTGDGREVLYIANHAGVRTLMRIPYDGSRPASPIEFTGPIGFDWAISPRGDRFVYRDHRADPDIWRVDLAGDKRPSRVLSSSGSDIGPQFSPDGKKVAFLSDRVRGLRLYVSDLDGANAVELARTARPYPGPARWSPDGARIVFECQTDGNDDICVVPAGGGAIRRITKHPARDCQASWSRDGRWIYFTSNRSGSFQVWKAPADGSEAEAVQLTKGGGFSPLESLDGATVYFANERIPAAIWKVPAGGGTEARVVDLKILGSSQTFEVSAEGIYYGSSSDPERWFDLLFYRFSTGKPEVVSKIDKKLWNGLSVSPDGRWLLFSAFEAPYGDLYMVENFR